MKTEQYGIVQKDLMTNPEIPLTHKCLYALLRTYFDPDLGYCYPSDKLLAENLNISSRTVSRWLKDLEDWGIIERIQISPHKRHIVLKC